MARSKFLAFCELIKVEHTVFALPFAYSGYFLAVQSDISWVSFSWITLAVLGARSAGMTLNRIADLKFDRTNPRTAKRPLCSGEIKVGEAWIFFAGSLLLLILSALQLHPNCVFWLFPVVCLIGIYHYLKRWTYLCHFGVGAVLLCAPLGGWVAITGSVQPAIAALAAGVFFWSSGLDIIYSVQDIDHDKEMKLHSLPRHFGKQKALFIALVSHSAAASSFFLSAFLFEANTLYYVTCLAASLLLIAEHVVIRINFAKYVNASFFTINGVLSAVFCLGVILSEVMKL